MRIFGLGSIYISNTHTEAAAGGAMKRFYASLGSFPGAGADG